MVELEKAGIPTVVILSNGFQRDADASAKAFGMAPIPRVEVPLVYNNITTDQAIEQTDPVVNEIMELLTKGITGEDIENQALQDAQFKRFKFKGEDQFGALDAFNKEFLDRDWGDGFPLIPPTGQKVARMLSGTTLDPEDVVCTLPPGNGIVTVQKIAVNCVMAGCEPEHLPVVIAACKAISNMDPFEARGLLMSTSAGAPLIVVNGPIRNEIGLNYRRATLGPGKMSKVNVTIGRAFTLTLKNGGHWYPGCFGHGHYWDAAEVQFLHRRERGGFALGPVPRREGLSTGAERGFDLPFGWRARSRKPGCRHGGWSVASRSRRRAVIRVPISRTFTASWTNRPAARR